MTDTAVTEETLTGEQVIYCHCAYANVIPDEIKNETLRELLSKGIEFQAVPDLCKMAAEGDERLATIAAADKATIVACYPRAVKGLFDRAGYPITIDDDKVSVINMREESSEAIVEALPAPSEPADKDADTVAAEQEELQQALMADAETEDAWKPWFPVVDYDRCTHCGLCANFCIFGVYRFEDNKLQVENPTNCKTDCPACARVCPETAIMFPKHGDSPINGSTAESDGEKAGVNMGKTMGGDVMGFLKNRSRRQRMRFAKHAIDAEKLCACAAESGMLADLGIPEEVLANSAADIQNAITANPELVQLAASAVQQSQSKDSE